MRAKKGQERAVPWIRSGGCSSGGRRVLSFWSYRYHLTAPFCTIYKLLPAATAKKETTATAKITGIPLGGVAQATRAPRDTPSVAFGRSIEQVT